MNKCHFYLNSGLWEIAKSYIGPDFNNEYFWRATVSPHQLCFGSHLLSSPWHQSWALLNLIESCQLLKNELTVGEIFTASELFAIRQDIDFQFTLRQYYHDSFVQKLFLAFTKIQTIGNQYEFSSEEWTTNCRNFFIRLLNENPSIGHTLVRHTYLKASQLLPPLQNDLPELIETYLSANVSNMSQFVIDNNLLKDSRNSSLLLLLLSSGHTEILKKGQDYEKSVFLSKITERFETILSNGINPADMIYGMIMSQKHFFPEILDMIMLRLNKLSVQTELTALPNFVWPLLLIKLWNKKDTNVEQQLQFLIDKTKGSVKDKAILQVSFTLEWLMKFCKWSEKHGGLDQKLLAEVQQHSVLYLINSTSDLARTDWNQVRELLEQGQHTSSMLWNLRVFDGYCIVCHVINALIAANDVAAAARVEIVTLENVAAADEVLLGLYHEEVVVPLELAASLLRQLLPLTFRLEILELIFATLFFTWDDVRFFISHQQSNIQDGLQSPNGLSAMLTGRGFIATKHILRDIIHMLKECLDELEKETKRDIDFEDGLTCSIKQNQWENRLDRLSESVSEALWRLQLVTEPEFVAARGHLVQGCGHDPHHFSSDWLVATDVWLDSPSKQKRRSTQQTHELQQQEHRQSCQDSNGSQSGGGSGTDDGVSIKKFDREVGPGLMHQMLGSDGALVLRCLAQNDFLNAEHIITMMSTEENRQTLEGELNFSQAINGLRKKLQCLSNENANRKLGAEKSKSKVQLIQQVANEAINSTALTNHMERFLSSTTLPTIQGSSKISLGSMLQCIENSAAIVTIDLALTAAVNFHEFRELLSLAGKHCSELATRAQAPLNPTANSKPFGYVIVAQNLLSLMQEINREATLSPTQYFRDKTYSFSLKTLKEGIATWRQLKHLFDDIKKSEIESDHVSSMVDCSVTGVGSVAARSQRNIKTTQKILENITKLTENSSELFDFACGRSDCPGVEISKHVNYSDLLNRYLTDLTTLAWDNFSSKSDPVAITFHNVLKRSAVHILDKLVFDYHIEPASLEKKAQQLGFNLSASLVWGCCPPIPQLPVLPPHTLTPSTVILNDYECDQSVVSDPTALIQTVLNQLICLFELKFKKILTRNDLFSLRSSNEIASILSQTSHLQYIHILDLSEIAINLFNLMSLHCWLSQKISKADPIFQEFSLKQEISQSFCGYEIGNLGFVSLADLKDILMNTENPFNSFGTNYSKNVDPKVIFVLPMYKFLGCPPLLKVIEQNNKESEMNAACRDYIKLNVQIDGQNLRIPPILNVYFDNLIKQLDNINVDRSKFILKFILDFFVQNNITDVDLQTIMALEIVPQDASNDIILRLKYYNHEEGNKIDSLNLNKKQKENDDATIRLNQWRTRGLSEAIAKQLGQSSRILTDLVHRIHEGQIELGKDVLLGDKLCYIDTLLGSSWATTLAPLYQGNSCLAALTKVPENTFLWNFLQKTISNKEWKLTFDILNALPDFFILNDYNLIRLKDLVLFQLACNHSKNGDVGSSINLCHLITDFRIKLDLLFKNCQYWPGNICIKQLASLLSDSTEVAFYNNVIQKEIKKISVFTTISEKCEEFVGNSWFDTWKLSTEEPKTLLKSLIDNNLVSLVVDWCQLSHGLEEISEYVTVELILKLSASIPRQLSTFLKTLPLEKVDELCEEALIAFDSVNSIRAISEIYLQIVENEKKKLKWQGVNLSIKLLSAIDCDEQLHLIHLIAEPVLIIEQLLMNTKLDALEIILKKLECLLEDQQLLPEKEINQLLINYASRAVEMNVITVIKQSTTENFVLNSTPPTPVFVVPPEVPSEEDWIPDNQVSICMNCHMLNFSMFNRRHHCRRCGRVVCSSCSKHRIKVTGYKDVAVRVCQPCYIYHMKPEMDTLTIQTETSSQGDFDHHWKLTIDPVRNATIREEFSYDYAPDVNLCLAIFNLIPPKPIYTSVLLDLSERLLQLFLNRDCAQSSEVDFTVLLQIIRSLILGAKVRYGQVAMTSGVDSCDRLLSQVDLLVLVVKNHCLNLVPSVPMTGHFVRQLRDRLVKEELWDLAIEVSTKGGLSPNGVWAAWGKVCLASGEWSEARTKFDQCLSAGAQRSSPILDEICDILNHTTTSYTSSEISAQEVVDLLASAQSISLGKGLPKMKPLQCPSGSPQHTEQIFYLTRYGDRSSLLHFYVKRGEWFAALEHIIALNLDLDLVLTTVILPAYKTESHNELKSNMTTMDSSLTLFKKYLLHACLYMEKKRYLHTLLDLQLFMQDFVRASMTCIQMYVMAPVDGGFGELLNRTQLLSSALKHLESELALLHKKTLRLDHVKKLDSRDINRHISTIWRQMEVSKYLAGCQAAGLPVMEVSMTINEKESSSDIDLVPTLFDGVHRKVMLAVLCILCGHNVEEGFGVSFRIIQDYQLNMNEVGSKAAKHLSLLGRGCEVHNLVACINTSGVDNAVGICDSVISATIPFIVSNSSSDLQVAEKLASLVSNLDTKISSLIDARQLKAAYLLATNHNKLHHVQRVLSEAERLGLDAMKKICMKKLGIGCDESPCGSILSSISAETNS